MRDDQTAFDYLTGALTGGALPDAVGRKFTPEGATLSCPGFNEACRVAVQDFRVAAQNRQLCERVVHRRKMAEQARQAGFDPVPRNAGFEHLLQPPDTNDFLKVKVR